jgi:hypothetical protein
MNQCANKCEFSFENNLMQILTPLGFPVFKNCYLCIKAKKCIFCARV